MDYQKLYSPFLLDGKIHPKAWQNPDFHKRVTLITKLLEEVEATQLKQVISSSLKCKALGRTDYVFLTINFDPSKSFEECFKAGQKLATRKIWEWSIYAHEQRGETPETAGHGHHLHIVAKIAAVNAKTRAKATVCSVCSVANSAIFNWKYIPEEYVIDKIAYIREDKALEKQLKQQMDKVWRLKNNISPIYYNACPKEVRKEAIRTKSEDSTTQELPHSDTTDDPDSNQA